MIFFDTEFIDDGRTIELISIGMVKDTGEEYYAESSEVDFSKASPWVMNNVVPSLTGKTKSRSEIAYDIRLFAGNSPEFWAWFASYDWVALCQLYGSMIDLPRNFPRFCHDLKSVLMLNGKELVEQPDSIHNALDDAKWLRKTALETLRW